LLKLLKHDQRLWIFWQSRLTVAMEQLRTPRSDQQSIVSAMLERLLHHGHVLKFGPRSWRTRLDAREQ
jgi:hypothetical protein